MFNLFGKFRAKPPKSEELDRFKELTGIPGVLDALDGYSRGVASVSFHIGPQVQECIHLSNTLTSRAAISSGVLFDAARTGRWGAVEKRLVAYDAALQDAGESASSDLDAIIQWAEQNNLPALKPYDAGFYKTTGIPRDKKKLMALRFIHLPSAGIRNVPAELAKLPNVQGICFNDNEIQELPEAICQMQKVSMLHLENNHIERLPESIGNMVSLNLIDLDGNNIGHLPQSLLKLRNLSKLRLSGQKHGIDLRFKTSPFDDASHSVLARLMMNPELDVSI